MIKRKPTHDHQPAVIDPEQEIIDKLHNAGIARNKSCRRRLDSGSTYDTYDGQPVGSYPLAAQERNSGNYEEGLTHLVLVGNVLLGISRGINRKVIGDRSQLWRIPADSIRVSVLPVGTHPSAQKHSSVTLMDVNPNQLNNPRPENGVVQSWESIEIGRDMLAESTGVEDSNVSARHATITIDSDGRIRIEDHSTNGTQVFDELDVSQSSEYGALDARGKIELAGLMRRFNEAPTQWDKSSAGATVINPHG